MRDGEPAIARHPPAKDPNASLRRPETVCSGLKQSHVFEGEALDNVAERGGFEPPVQETPHNRLATWPVQPLRHLSAMSRLGLFGPLRMGS